MGGGAWPFLVRGVICLVNSDNERDSNFLNRCRQGYDVETLYAQNPLYGIMFSDIILYMVLLYCKWSRTWWFVRTRHLLLKWTNCV